jgi:RNA polymerase sigma-70 factor (ECF subfamily)
MTLRLTVQNISMLRAALPTLVGEAEAGARRLVRRLSLQDHYREDIRQDLLVDLLLRLRAYDPGRGTVAAFAGTIVRHRSARLARRVRRERTVFSSVSLDTPVAGTDGSTVGENVAEASGYAAFMGQPADQFDAIERRLDLELAVSALRPADIPLCSDLLERTPIEICRDRHVSRASLYRQLGEIRLRLTMLGMSLGQGARA